MPNPQWTSPPADDHRPHQDLHGDHQDRRRAPSPPRSIAKTAPTAVNEFVFLANHKYYNCLTFHRVIPYFMDQTGDPTGTGDGAVGYTVAG